MIISSHLTIKCTPVIEIIPQHDTANAVFRCGDGVFRAGQYRIFCPTWYFVGHKIQIWSPLIGKSCFSWLGTNRIFYGFLLAEKKSYMCRVHD